MNQQQSASDTRTYDALANAMGPVVRDLMEDDRVIELMLNSDGQLWAEYLGEGIRNTGHHVSSNDAESMIRLVAGHTGQECNESSPTLAAILPMSGARFQAFIPPVADRPAFSIRKKAIKVFSLDDYVNADIMTREQKSLLESAVRERKNILIVGGTGSGKTTLANAILKEIGETDDRVVTIEDVPELQCVSKNKQQLYTKPEVGFSMQQAVKHVLRFRPDRIVIGEVRDGAALDFLKALNTGHSGGIATIHANDAKMALRRLESLIEEVVVKAPRDLIMEAVHLIVVINRTSNKRIISEIATPKSCGL